MTITGSGLWDAGRGSLFIGSSSGSSPGTNNSVLVSAGGVLTNVSQGSYSFAVGASVRAEFNALTVTNGGLVYMNSGSVTIGAYQGAAGGNNNTLSVGGGQLTCDSVSYVGNNSSNNGARVYGRTLWNAGGKTVYIGAGGATGNVLTIDSGAVLTNAGPVVAGGASPANGNSLVIGASGSVFASVAAAGASQAVNNVISVLPGGLLEAGTLTNGVGAGNIITNSGGVYQFATATPNLVPNGNPIVLENGAIAFRGINTADVRSPALAGLSWIGTNAFRLNAASNTTTLTQGYLFDPGFAPTNYARLEMVNGATCYRGQNTNCLTIGASAGSGGQMLCSNTAATVAMVFTNNGTLTIINSTLALTTNAVFNGAVVIDLNRLMTTSGVISAQRAFTLGTNSALAFTGAPTNMTLLTTAAGYTGRFGSVSGLPPNYSLNYGSAGVSIRYAPVVTAIFFQ